MWRIAIAVLVYIFGFGVERILALPTTLISEKTSCYTFVLGQDVTSKEEEKAVWENEITGTELAKCMLTQHGVIGINGLNIRNVSKYHQAMSKCPALVEIRMKKVFEDCARVAADVASRGDEEEEYEIARCIYYAAQKTYNAQATRFSSL